MSQRDYFKDPYYGLVEHVKVPLACVARVVDLGNWRRGVAVLCSTEDGKEYSGYVEYEYGLPHGELYAHCFGEGDRCVPLIRDALRRGKVVEKADFAYALRVVRPHGRDDYEARYYPLPDHHVGLGLVRARGREAQFAVRPLWTDDRLAEVADRLARELGDRKAVDSALYHIVGEPYKAVMERRRRSGKRRKKAPA